MTGRIASDVTTPVMAHRVVQVHFTKAELEALLCERAAEVVGLDALGADAGLTAWKDIDIPDGWNVRVEFDVPPAATPAPRPMTAGLIAALDADAAAHGHAPASAPPPAERTLFWFEFSVVAKGRADRIGAAWGHGQSEGEALLDARIRHEGERGLVMPHSLCTMIDLPFNVPELQYSFELPGHGVCRIGTGCTESHAWRYIVGHEPALAPLKYRVTEKRRVRLPCGSPGSWGPNFQPNSDA